MFKNNNLARKEFDYLIVSDASSSLFRKEWSFYRPLKSAYRLVHIAQDQVRALRSRALVNSFKNNPGSGVLLRMGNTSEYIFNSANVTGVIKNALLESDIKKIASMETTLRKLTISEFDLLEQHGWEVCEATTFGYESLKE